MVTDADADGRARAILRHFLILPLRFRHGRCFPLLSISCLRRGHYGTDDDRGGGGRLQRQRDLDRGSEEEGSLLVSSFIKAEKMFTH